MFSDYLVRLMKFIDFAKRAVPLNDDLFDFFYDAMPGYEEVGRRRVLLGCWGSFQDPNVVDYQYENMTTWGRAMKVTPGIVVDGELITTDLVEINLGIRILLGSSYYDDWEEEEMFVTHDPLGNPVDKRHPWNQTTLPKPQKRQLDGGPYSWVMSPRWFWKKTGEHLPLDTGGGPLARLWSTALAGIVDTQNVKSTGKSVKIHLPKTISSGETELEWKIPKWANTLERDRARAYFIAYAAAMALDFVENALQRVYKGDVKTFEDFKVPDDAIGCGFHEAVRGVLSHHLVMRDGKIANYHPYPPTPWNASPRDSFGTTGAVRGCGAGFEALRRERARQVQGHRHHAHGAQLRSVPALRRAHVRRARRQGARRVALADAGRAQPEIGGELVKTTDNLIVGKPDVEPSAPSHSFGVREGNMRKSRARATARRSTGINAKQHVPIDPRMPVLTPA